MQTKPASTLTVVIFWVIVAISVWSCTGGDEKTETPARSLTSEEMELTNYIKGMSPNAAWSFGSAAGKTDAARTSVFGNNARLEFAAMMVERFANIEQHAKETGVNVQTLHSYVDGYSTGFRSESR